MQFRASLLFALAVLLTGALATATAADFEWSGRVAPGKTVSVEGINGDIKAVGSESNIVEITAVKSGKGRRPGEGRGE